MFTILVEPKFFFTKQVSEFCFTEQKVSLNILGSVQMSYNLICKLYKLDYKLKFCLLIHFFNLNLLISYFLVNKNFDIYSPISMSG